MYMCSFAPIKGNVQLYMYISIISKGILALIFSNNFLTYQGKNIN